jgi:hypothetical protein
VVRLYVGEEVAGGTDVDWALARGRRARMRVRSFKLVIERYDTGRKGLAEVGHSYRLSKGLVCVVRKAWHLLFRMEKKRLFAQSGFLRSTSATQFPPCYNSSPYVRHKT